MSVSVLGLFVAFVLACLAIWVVQRLVAAFEIPAPLAQLAVVAVVVIAVLYVLAAVTGHAPLILLR